MVRDNDGGIEGFFGAEAVVAEWIEDFLGQVAVVAFRISGPDPAGPGAVGG